MFPTSAPSEEERARHYLWRFWRTFPPVGSLAIYDRSWYGRVLVERVEGFATEEQWTRAYEEICEMEQSLVREGAILCKFWLEISPEEQLQLTANEILTFLNGANTDGALLLKIIHHLFVTVRALCITSQTSLKKLLTLTK